MITIGANKRNRIPMAFSSTTTEEILESDAILILTEWEEFNELDWRGKIVMDGRRVPKAMEARIYEGICW